MAHPESDARVLNDAQIAHFVERGFVRIDNAFPPELAEAARAILWRDLRCDPWDPASWTKPVIRLGMYSDAPFVGRPPAALVMTTI